MRTVAVFVLIMSAFAAYGQELSGIGVALGRDGQDFVVKGVIPESPAALSKAIHRGDRIISIGQGTEELVDISESGLEEVVNLIRGPKGTAVRIKLVAADKEDSEAQIVSLVRGELKIPRSERTAGLDRFTILSLRLAFAVAHPY